MWKYLYGTVRPRNYTNTINLQNESLNGWYDPTFFTKNQFLDYELANITKTSMPIPNDKYIWVTPEIDENENLTGKTFPNLTRFITVRYSDKFTNEAELIKSVEKANSDTDVRIFSMEDARQWIRTRTNLQEVEEGKFLISEESTSPMTWEIVPAQYLEIS